MKSRASSKLAILTLFNTRMMSRCEYVADFILSDLLLGKNPHKNKASPPEKDIFNDSSHLVSLPRPDSQEVRFFTSLQTNAADGRRPRLLGHLKNTHTHTQYFFE